MEDAFPLGGAIAAVGKDGDELHRPSAGVQQRRDRSPATHVFSGLVSTLPIGCSPESISARADGPSPSSSFSVPPLNVGPAIH